MSGASGERSSETGQLLGRFLLLMVPGHCSGMRELTLDVGGIMGTVSIPVVLKRVAWRIYFFLADRLGIFNGFLNLCKNILVWAEFIRQPEIRLAVLESTRFLGDAALALKQIAPLPVHRFEGLSGQAIFVGDAIAADEFRSLFYGAETVTQAALTPVSSRDLNETVPVWLEGQADLVVCELSRFTRRRIQAPLQVTIPKWIAQAVPLPSDMAGLLAGKKGRDIRNALNKNPDLMNYIYSQEKSDFDLFYHSMYVPYVLQRHGSLAFVEPYALLLHYFKRGGVVFVCKQGEPIAGSLVFRRTNWIYAVDGGVLNADSGLFKADIYRIMAWASIDWAISQGVERMHLGGTYAWRSNGIFRFKRDWRCNVIPLYGFIRGSWIFSMNQPSAEMIDRLNERGLITENNGKYYGVIFERENSDPALSELSRDFDAAQQDGLAGLAVVSSVGTIFIETPAPELAGQSALQPALGRLDKGHLGKNTAPNDIHKEPSHVS